MSFILLRTETIKPSCCLFLPSLLIHRIKYSMYLSSCNTQFSITHKTVRSKATCYHRFTKVQNEHHTGNSSTNNNNNKNDESECVIVIPSRQSMTIWGLTSQSRLQRWTLPTVQSAAAHTLYISDQHADWCNADSVDASLSKSRSMEAAVVYEATNGHQTRSSKSESSAGCELQNGDSSLRRDDELVLENGLSRLPKTLPVDMRFENISFTASLGFRKGRSYFAVVYL